MKISSKYHRELLTKSGAWSIAIFFGVQSMLFYETATWLPTILVSKGWSLGNAGFVVSITGLLGSVICIVAPHYSSELGDLRILLVDVGELISISFAGMMVDHGWRLVIWLLISYIALIFPVVLGFFLVAAGYFAGNPEKILHFTVRNKLKCIQLSCL